MEEIIFRKNQNISLLEAINLFGEDAYPVLRDKLENLSCLEKNFEKLLKEKVRAARNHLGNSDSFSQWFLVRALTIRSATKLADIKNEKNNIVRAINLYKAHPNKDWETRLFRAREFPISDLYPGKLKRSGKSYRGLCPFHKEKTPSFYIYPIQNRFKCFGCQIYGDSLTFLMKLQNVDFKNAVWRLS